MEKSYDVIPVAIDCHPTADVIGVGFIDGTVSSSSFHFEEFKQPRKNVFDPSNQFVRLTKVRLTELHQRHHKRAVRRLKFGPDTGDHLMVITKNRALCQWDVESGRKLRCIQEAHDSPPFALHCLTDHLIATGDEDGEIKLWDWRVGAKPPCVATFGETHLEIINDLTSSADHKTLLAASGDLTLSAFNLKKLKMEMQSEEMEKELLSVVVARNGQTVLCGSGEGGFIEIFKWGEFGNIAGRMQTGHDQSVDRLLNIDESGLVASASSDGTIRLLRFGPNADLGCIGEHTDDRGQTKAPVEDLAITKDREYLVSCGHDQKVRFWDLDKHLRGNDEGDGGAPSAKKAKKSKKAVDTGFFEGLTQESKEVGNNQEDSDDEESD